MTAALHTVRDSRLCSYRHNDAQQQHAPNEKHCNADYIEIGGRSERRKERSDKYFYFLEGKHVNVSIQEEESG